MQIPSEFRGRQVAGWIESEDYQAINTAIELSGSDVDLIVKKKIKSFDLAGSVSDAHGTPLQGVHISLPEFGLKGTTNADGRFMVHVIADYSGMVDLTASKEGYETKYLRPTLGDSGVNFSLEEKR